MKGRIFVDLSTDEKYGEGLDELLRLIFEQPLYPEPSLGEAPSFLKADGGGLPVAKELSGTIRAIRDGKASREGLEALFAKSVIAEVDRQYVRPEGEEGYDEELYQAILRTKGLRDQVSEYADTIASFASDEPKALRSCIYLLEQLGQRFRPPTENGSYLESWADIYRFFALEVSLIVTASLLRYERWQSLRHLLKYPYLIQSNHSGLSTGDICAFDSFIVSMDEHRNNRLRTNRASFTADMLKERCSQDQTSFQELVQADVFLTLYAVAHLSETKKNGVYRFWAPRTTVYSSDAQRLPVFLKAIDPDIRRGIWTALSVSSAADLAGRIESARPELDDFRQLSLGRFPRFNFVGSANLQTLIK